jgi:hypothetical protein
MWPILLPVGHFQLTQDIFSPSAAWSSWHLSPIFAAILLPLAAAYVRAEMGERSDLGRKRRRARTFFMPDSPANAAAAVGRTKLDSSAQLNSCLGLRHRKV